MFINTLLRYDMYGPSLKDLGLKIIGSEQDTKDPLSQTQEKPKEERREPIYEKDSVSISKEAKQLAISPNEEGQHSSPLSYSSELAGKEGNGASVKNVFAATHQTTEDPAYAQAFTLSNQAAEISQPLAEKVALHQLSQ